MLEKAWWEAEDELANEAATVEETSNRDIAIIGMSVRLPGADDVRALWDRITGQYDAVGPFLDSRRQDVDSLLTGTKLPGGNVSYYDGAYLDEIDKFDYRFFRLSPKEAALMNPNQRLWLETAWSAIEDAGYGGRKLIGSKTGVYVGYNGDAFHDYKRLVATRDPSSLSLAIPGNLSSIVASRISYLLDFKGPSITVDTACSSSLVALHLAIQSLRSGECEQALVGGVKTYLLPVDMGFRIGIESSDSRARTFDDRSDGTGGGEGAGAVLLKPLGKALRDGDAIYAVIKGSAVNQDGASVGITAPNGRAQEEVIVKAWQDADIDPESIGYIEAHGTGTRLGDPIEIEGITQAFRQHTSRSQFCAIGSIKTNYGHLDTAAGIVGLIKAALALKHKQLPPMLHFREPNRTIPFMDSPVYISDLLRPWTQSGQSPRRAGISSFGMSGTNVHAVLEEFQPTEMQSISDGNGQLQALVLSAKSETALLSLARNYSCFLEDPAEQEVSLSSLCYTVNTGRGHYEYRAALAVSSLGELRDKLRLLVKGLEEAPLSGNEWSSGIWLGKAKGAVEISFIAPEEILGYTPEKLCLSYVEGGNWDWETLYRQSDNRKIHLPTYPFDRTRCWVEQTESAINANYSEPGAAIGSASPSTVADPTRDDVQLMGRSGDHYSDTERTVARAWGHVLGFTTLGIDDHYYELGGDSILALQIVGQLSREIGWEVGVADLLRHPSVSSLSAFLEDSNANSAALPSQASDAALTKTTTVHPLSRAQHRIFLGSQLPETERYQHMPLAYVVDGALQTDRLQAAFGKLAERHASLRTTFEWSDEGEPLQTIHPHLAVQVEAEQVASETDWPSYAASFIRPFDPSQLPLFRVGVATVSQNRHLLILDTHHLVSDGASLALLLQEMMALYDARPLSPKALDYQDYIRWQREQANSPAMLKQRSYWLEDVLVQPLPQLRLPLDFPRPKIKTPHGNIYRFSLPAELTEALQQLAKQQQVSLHTVLFALYAVLMNRYSGQEDLIIGSLVGGRDQAEFRQIVGVFINFLPIRLRVSTDMSFLSLLDEVQRCSLDAYDNGQLPFDEMVSALNAGTSRSRNPLYDTMLVFHNHSSGSERFASGGLTFSEFALDRETSALDVKLDLFPGASGELHGVLEYHPGLFHELTIALMSKHFVQLAAAVTEEAGLELGQIRLFDLSEEAVLERRRRLNDGQQPTTGRRLEVRIASTFTSEPVAKSLSHWLSRFGIDAQLNFLAYNQVIQHVLDNPTELPDGSALNVLLIRPEDWLSPQAQTVEAGLIRLEEDLDRLISLLTDRSADGPYFVGLMPLYGNSPLLGLTEETLRLFRERWHARVAVVANTYLIDFTETAAHYRVNQWEDLIANEEGHIPYTEQAFAAIGTQIARTIIGWHGQPFKVITVDADNTLWCGVCGEEGPEGVKVTPSFLAFQQLLLRKRSEGMLLALCSKNNESDLWDVFDRNPGMVLRKEHFAAWRVNWEPKPDNLREMAEELRLGLDSFIFVDDNAVECLGMMAHCPDVLTLKLPEENEIPPFLAHVWAWDRLRVTEEDRNRAGSYEAERLRKEAAGNGGTLQDYLQSLGMKVSMRALASDETERAAQLTVRTNQFNLSGIRRTDKEIRDLLQDEGAFLWIVEAADRYGTYGRIGLVTATVQDSALVLDSFLLSCRVLGRGVEQTICASLKHFALSNGCSELIAQFRKTAKNSPFGRFLEQEGWHRKEMAGRVDGQIAPYSILLSDLPDVPEHVSFYDGFSFEPEAAYDLTAAAKPEGLSDSLKWNTFVDEGESKKYDWVFSSDNEQLLLHRAYLLPLRYSDAAAIVSLPDERAGEGSRYTGGPYEAPANETELAIAKLWERLLGGGPYGRMDHFFDAGGNSLQAATLISELVRTFGIRVKLIDLFDNALLKQMASLMTRDGVEAEADYKAIPKAVGAELYPVTAAQRRMYFLQQFEPDGTAYQIPTALRLTGKLNVERMQQALRKLAERHEGLRTSFVLQDGEPYQRIHETITLEFEEKEVAEDQLLQAAARAFVRPFELDRAPLFRTALFRSGENNHVMVFDIHHIVADGVSVNVLMDEFLLLYGGEGHTLPPLALQYKDYAVWQRNQMESGRIAEQMKGWIQKFSGSIPRLDLPSDAARPAVKSTEGSQFVIRLNKEQTEGLNRLAEQTRSTLFMVLLTAYAAWLMKLTRQSDLVIGTPVAGRTHPDLAQLVGVFVNPLPIRITAEPSDSIQEMLANVKLAVLSALDLQEVPFEHVVEQLQVERDISRNPLFDTMFSMLNMAHADLSAADVTVKPFPIDFGVSQFDVGLSALEEDDMLTLTVQYASKLYNAATMARWVGGFHSLLRSFGVNPAARISDIDMLSAEDKHQVVETFNDTIAPYPQELTLQMMFCRQAERTPERMAAVFETERLTYRELDERSNRIARRLLDAGLKPEQPVGLMAERSPAMLAGMLGILKAGGAYVPLPPDFPEERLGYMAGNAGISLICSQRNWLKEAGKAAPAAELVDLDDEALLEEGLVQLPDIVCSPEQLAYILYTSGSTGRPKGVMIRHTSVINRLNWMQKSYPLCEDDVILQKTPYSFDVSVWELNWWMLAGASVAVLPPGAEKDPSLLIEAIDRHKVTTMHFVPSMLAAFLESANNVENDRLKKKLSTLKRVFASGEALHKAHADRFYSLTGSIGLTDAKLVNLYGPTEATVDVSVHECEPDSQLDFVPIGRPIDNTSLYIVSGNVAQPIGVPGELCIAGVQLARGYVNQPELTAEKFVPDPFVPGGLMYRTGDLARWMEDGQVQYLGRIDDQVKIRGYRIELGEIERTLLLHEAISEAAVMVQEDEGGGKRLCGYVVATQDCTSGELWRHCGEHLPEYMIPAAFVQLAAMPLTASGKTDRKRLPRPESEMATGVAYAAPVSEMEEKLVALWQELLQREAIGIDDNFFELGGHSLTAATLTARIEQLFTIRLPLKEVFMNPTVRKLGLKLLSGMGERSYPRISSAEAKPHYAVSSAQKQMLVHEQMSPGSLSYHMPTALLLSGSLDQDKLRNSLKQLADRHESLRTSFAQVEGDLVQVVHESIDISFEWIERNADFASHEKAWEALALTWLRPFNLAEAPLFRTALIPMEDDRHLLLFDIHHAICDGVTNGILIRDLIAMYEDRTLPAVTVQFKDYSEWLSRLLTGEEKERHNRYWLNRFADGIPRLPLPVDADRAMLTDPVLRDEAERYRFTVDADVLEALERLALSSGATLFMILLSSYQAMLGYWSGTPDVVTGVPAAGRSHPELTNTTGLLLQTLAIRNRPNPSLSFESWLMEVKENMLQDFDHPWLPVEELVELLDERGLIRWDAARHPLFDTMFVMQNMDESPTSADKLRFEPLEWDFAAAKLDLVLQAEQRGGKLMLSFEYRSRLLRLDTVAQMAEGLLKFMERAVAQPQATLEELTGLSNKPGQSKQEVGIGQDWFEEGFNF